jgi:DNA-binding NarL/FixJ family response regulator
MAIQPLISHLRLTAHQCAARQEKHMNASAENIRVWLVEDNEIYRRGLARAIDSAKGMSCGGEFDCAETALEALNGRSDPEVILLDVGLPGIDGLAALERIRELSPKSRVVILTVFNDSDKIFKAVCSGANGYLLKTASTDAVVTAVRQAAEGGAPMGAEVAQRVLTLFGRLAKTKMAKAEDYGLSPREQEVLEQMAEGLVTKQIAVALNVSVHTVTNHIRSIYAKLHVNTNTGAVAKAIREGLV